MASPALEIIPAQAAPTSQTTLYTSTLVVTRIDKLTVINTGVVNVSISINIVPSGGSVGTSNLTTNAQTLIPKQSWNSPNEQGHYLNAGDFISVLASGAGLTIIAGGTQIS